MDMEIEVKIIDLQMENDIDRNYRFFILNDLISIIFVRLLNKRTIHCCHKNCSIC